MSGLLLDNESTANISFLLDYLFNIENGFRKTDVFLSFALSDSAAADYSAFDGRNFCATSKCMLNDRALYQSLKISSNSVVVYLQHKTVVQGGISSSKVNFESKIKI